MPECFVSFIIDNEFHCRCSLGDLLEGEEVDEFKKQSGLLEPGGLFVFHEGVSPDSVAKRYERRKLLDKFTSENSIEFDPRPMIPVDDNLYVLQTPYNLLPYDPPPHIKKMREFIRIAEDIRKDRPNDTIEVTAPAALSETEATATALTDTAQQSGSKTANELLCDFLKKRPECRSWSSVDLGKQINVSGATVRKTVMWSLLSQEQGAVKERNKIKMKLNNEYLPVAEREELENRLRDLGNRRET